MIKFKEFNEGIDERSYSLGSKLLNLKRKTQVTIGKARRSAANKLESDIVKAIDDNRKWHKILAENSGMNDPKLNRRIIHQVRNKNGRVLKGDGNGASYASSTKDLDSTNIAKIKDSDLRRKLTNVKSSNDFIVSYNGEGTSTMAHELGHIQNATSKNPIVRLTHDVSIKNPPSEVNKDYNKKSGLGTSIKEWMKGRIQLTEESRASKNALETLRNSGATNRQLGMAKAEMDAALETYRTSHEARWKRPLRNMIQIPSRKSTTPKDWRNRI